MMEDTAGNRNEEKGLLKRNKKKKIKMVPAVSDAPRDINKQLNLFRTSSNASL